MHTLPRMDRRPTQTEDWAEKSNKQPREVTDRNTCLKIMNADTNTIVVEPGRNGIGLNETVLPTPFPRGTTPDKSSTPSIHWSWACRKVNASRIPLEDPASAAPPVAGDVALVQVETTEFHKHITTAENRRLRLYPGAQFVGVFGNRYAAAAFEAEIQGICNLNMLTAAGMIGTVKSKHHHSADPTQLSLIGFLRDTDGRRLNLKQRLFQPAKERRLPKNILYIVGSGMNSGKTTTAARLIKSLCRMGLNVAACKLTGSVSNRDQDEMAAAAEHQCIDFSDFGFPSTYLCPKEELMDLFYTMMTELTPGDPDIVLVELADGVLQRETAMLLAEAEILRAGRGVILTAGGSLSALWGADRLRELGHNVVAVSGRFTSSPLAMREFTENDSNIPVASSADTGDELAQRVRALLS